MSSTRLRARSACSTARPKRNAGGKMIKVDGGHELALINNPKFKTHGFDKKTYEDDLYRWCSLRSSYLAEANVSAAKMYYAGGPGWYGPGWYWDPWFTPIPGFPVMESSGARSAGVSTRRSSSGMLRSTATASATIIASARATMPAVAGSRAANGGVFPWRICGARTGWICCATAD